MAALSAQRAARIAHGFGKHAGPFGATAPVFNIRCELADLSHIGSRHQVAG
jgi:hypothetical protein